MNAIGGLVMGLFIFSICFYWVFQERVMSNLITVNTGVSNYYGCVDFVKKDDGKYYLELENYSGYDRIEISKEFFEAAKKEFCK